MAEWDRRKHHPVSGLNAYQRLAQDSINYQMRMHAAEAERDELKAELEKLRAEFDSDGSLKPVQD